MSATDDRWPTPSEAAVAVAGVIVGLDGAGLTAERLRTGSWALALLDAGAVVLIVGSCWMVAWRDYLRRRHGSEETQR